MQVCVVSRCVCVWNATAIFFFLPWYNAHAFSSTVEIMIIIECLHLPNTLHFYWESIYEEFNGKLVIIVRSKHVYKHICTVEHRKNVAAEFIMLGSVFSAFVLTLSWTQRKRKTKQKKNRICKTLWFILFSFSSFVFFYGIFLTFTFDFQCAMLFEIGRDTSNGTNTCKQSFYRCVSFTSFPIIWYRDFISFPYDVPLFWIGSNSIAHCHILF